AQAMWSVPLDSVVLGMAGVAARAPVSEARHGRPLASECVCSLLDVEVTPKARATGGGCLDSRPDSTDESSQQAGEHRESMASSSSWESKWRHRLSVSICGERANHPRKRGERSSRIIWRRWLRWTSSRYRRPPFACYSFSSCCRTIGDAYCTGT